MTNYHDINDNIESLAGNNLHRGNEVIPAVLDALTSDVKTIDLFKYDYMWADSLLSLMHMEWHSMPEVNGAHPTVELTFAQAYTPTPSGWAILNRLTTKPAIIHNVLLEVTVAKYSTGATVIIDQSTRFTWIRRYRNFLHIHPHRRVLPPHKPKTKSNGILFEP
jgi:hypothetical protein